MRDVLTNEDIKALMAPLNYRIARPSREALQAAARLGAERERERCAALCEHLSTRAGTADECAEAIRRGEEGQAWPCD